MFRRHAIAVIATLSIAFTALPGTAAAMPARDGSVGNGRVETSRPAPTVVRTVVREEALQALPLVLAGVALLIAFGGTAVSVRRVPPLHH